MKKFTIPFLVLYIFSFTVINTNSGKVPYAFFYLLTAILIGSVIYVFLIALMFKFSQTIDVRHAVKGEKIKLSVIFSNEFFIFYPYVRIKYFNSSKIFQNQFPDKIFMLKPFSSIRFDYELACKYRGEYNVGIEYIELSDFFNIFSFKYKVKEPYILTVSPRIVNINDLQLTSGYLSESASLIKTGTEDLSTISDFRRYEYGDSMKRIHWKLSAKRNNLYVKNYEHTTAYNIVLVLDLRRIDCDPTDKIIIEDKLIEAAISIVYYCLKNNISTEIIYYDNDVKSIKAYDLHDYKYIHDIFTTITFSSCFNVSNILNDYLKGDNTKSNLWLLTFCMNIDIYEIIFNAKLGGYDPAIINFCLAGNNETAYQNADMFSSLREMGINCVDVPFESDYMF